MYLLISLPLVFISSANLFASVIFLKDGSIIEGTVTEKNSEKISLETDKKITMQVPADMVLRIIEGDSYKKRIEVIKKDGSRIKGYPVEVTEEKIVLRTDLKSALEIVLVRADIKEIVGKENLTVTATDRDDIKKEYSTNKALLFSLIPAWSGSFIVERNGVGAGLVIGKAFSFFLPISFFLATKMQGSDSGAGDYNYFENNPTIKWFTIGCAISWGVFTAADMIFSYYYVKGVNEKNSMAYGNRSSVYFSLSPRVMVTEPVGRKESDVFVEGVNFSVGVRY